jgi:hypothetical protein
VAEGARAGASADRWARGVSDRGGGRTDRALEADARVAAAALAALLLRSDQLPRLLESASRTFVQWSSVVAVANAAAGLPPLGVLVVLAEHASHLCACSHTSIEITHIIQI